MAAFNNIKVQTLCPACGEQTDAKLQLHLAASFDSDEISGFYHINYKVGDVLRWWNPNHPRYKSWLTDYAIVPTDVGFAECCYGECSRCRADLYAIVVVNGLLIEKSPKSD